MRLYFIDIQELVCIMCLKSLVVCMADKRKTKLIIFNYVRRRVRCIVGRIVRPSRPVWTR